jgi:alpha-tubulin suppressor-like RCC1 family protein
LTRESATPAYLPSLMDYASSRLQVVTASVSTAGGCAIRLNQSFLCWGAFSSANTMVSSDAGGWTFAGDGAAFGGPDMFETVYVGRAHACGIATRGGVRDVECWGDNTFGQAGFQGVSPVAAPAPVGLSQYGQVIQLAVGGNQSCAVVQNAGVVQNSVYCWGAIEGGQPLGAGAGSAVRKVAFGTRVGGLPSDVVVADSHACARMTDTSLWCWGDNSAAQLGHGPAGPAQATPSPVQRRNAAGTPFLVGVDRVAAGGKTTCVTMLTDPNVRCWGANEYGQAGQPPQGKPVEYVTPVSW